MAIPSCCPLWVNAIRVLLSLIPLGIHGTAYNAKYTQWDSGSGSYAMDAKWYVAWNVGGEEAWNLTCAVEPEGEACSPCCLKYPQGLWLPCWAQWVQNSLV